MSSPVIVAANDNDDKWTAAEIYAVLSAKQAINALDTDGFQKLMTPAINSKIQRLGYPESELKNGIRGTASNETTTSAVVVTASRPRSMGTYRPKYR